MDRRDPPRLTCDHPRCDSHALWLVLPVDEREPGGRGQAWTFSDYAHAYCDAHMRGPRLSSGPGMPR